MCNLWMLSQRTISILQDLILRASRHHLQPSHRDFLSNLPMVSHQMLNLRMECLVSLILQPLLLHKCSLSHRYSLVLHKLSHSPEHSQSLSHNHNHSHSQLDHHSNLSSLNRSLSHRPRRVPPSHFPSLSMTMANTWVKFMTEDKSLRGE